MAVNFATLVAPVVSTIVNIVAAVLAIGAILTWVYVTSSGARKVVAAIKGGLDRQREAATRRREEAAFRVRFERDERRRLARESRRAQELRYRNYARSKRIKHVRL
jgi:hypothetical protein